MMLICNIFTVSTAISCVNISQHLYIVCAGAGHGGRGGGASTATTGAPHGQLVEPVDPGCTGGAGITGRSTGALGGGVIYIRADDYLQNDGLISANADHSTLAAGGGSGGSILMDINNIKVIKNH